MLRRSGLIADCVPPVSMSFAVGRDFYIAALTKTHKTCTPDSPARSEAQTAWTSLLANAATAGTLIAQRVAAHVSAIQHDWRHRLRSVGARPASAAMALAELLTSHPIVNARTAAELAGATMRTTYRTLNLLTEAGIVVQTSAGTRNRVCEAPAVMELLSALVSLQMPLPLPPAPPPPSPG